MGCGGSKPSSSDGRRGSDNVRQPNKHRKQVGAAAVRKKQSRDNKRPISSKFRYPDERPTAIDTTTLRKQPKGLRRPSLPIRRQSSRDLYFPPMEGENLPLEGNWELEKGSDYTTLLTDHSYPVPRPPKFQPSSERYPDADETGIHISVKDPKLASKTYEECAKALTSQFSLDVLKVRVVVVWMSAQKIRTRTYGADAKPGTPLGYMKAIKEGAGTYAALLALLLRSINIPCVIVKGRLKSSFHKVGEDDLRESKCTWNCVCMDGSWQIVHPFLICTPLATATPMQDWKLIETNRPTPACKLGTILNTFFFAPKPSEFVHCCLPEDNMCFWQLLEHKTHYKSFLNLPFLRPGFFTNKLTLKSDEKSTLIADAGKCTIKVKGSEDHLRELTLMYELYSADLDLQAEEDWGELTISGRNEEVWNIQVRLPVEGVFKVSLYGMLRDWLFWMADFKVICSQRLENFKRLPAVPVDKRWGPMIITEEAGLLAPSHQGGIIFYRPNEEHTLKFILHPRRIKTTWKLEQDGRDKEELQRHCRMSVSRGEVNFVVSLPWHGDTALRISVDEEPDGELNVCNYLFTDFDEDSRKREDVFQRKAHQDLRKATVGHDIDAIVAAIRKCTKAKLDEDEDMVRGRRRIRLLKLKRGLRDGQMRRHEQILAQAINDAETSEFCGALQPQIDSSTGLLNNLKSLEMHCHPVMELDQKIISEIGNFNCPPREVHLVMTAVYLLLGEDRKTLNEWGHIQALLRRQNKESIKYRVNEFHRGGRINEVDRATIQAVRDIHNNVPKEYILSASLSATTFYNWVKNMLNDLNDISQNAAESPCDLSSENFTQNATDEKLHDDIIDDAYISQDEGFMDSQEATEKGSNAQVGESQVHIHCVK